MRSQNAGRLATAAMCGVGALLWAWIAQHEFAQGSFAYVLIDCACALLCGAVSVANAVTLRRGE